MNPFRSLLSLILGSALVLTFAAAGPGVWWYDRHFSGWEWHGPVFGWPAIKLAPGLAVADQKAIADDLWAFNTERASFLKVYAGLTHQNAAVAALSAQGVKARAQAETALTAQRRASARASAMALILEQPIPGDTECDRAKAFDQRFIGELRQ